MRAPPEKLSHALPQLVCRFTPGRPPVDGLLVQGTHLATQDEWETTDPPGRVTRVSHVDEVSVQHDRDLLLSVIRVEQVEARGTKRDPRVHWFLTLDHMLPQRLVRTTEGDGPAPQAGLWGNLAAKGAARVCAWMLLGYLCTSHCLCVRWNLLGLAHSKEDIGHPSQLSIINPTLIDVETPLRQKRSESAWDAGRRDVLIALWCKTASQADLQERKEVNYA